jgi:SRSO17 transposase
MRKSNRKQSIHQPPASGRPPTMRWSLREVQASADELITFHRLFHAVFGRREQREWSALYLCGQLCNLERKTIEPMVAAFRGADPNAMRGLQRFISQETWPAEKLILRLQELVAVGLGDPAGVVIVDGSGFAKQGQSSVGVARQYCGAVGKVANSQEGVFMVYASRHGYAFLDERLYVHESWFADAARERWERCGIPNDLRFQTEPDLALDMLKGLIMRAEVPFRWVTADAHFGEVPTFLDGVDALGQWYLIEVPCDTRGWLRTPTVEPPGCGVFGRPRTQPRVARSAPRPCELRELAARLPQTAWTRHLIKEGSKGPIIADFAFLRVTSVRAGLPGPRVWAIFRRRCGTEPELKFYLSNAPTTCPRAEFVRVSGLRWPIETALEEGKGEVGMDQYETRSWVSWHHQMAHSFMAHLFLVRLCLMFKKKSCLDSRASASVNRTRFGRRASRLSRHRIHHHLLPTAKLRRLLLASPAPTRAKSLILTCASTVKVSESYEVSV